jgi:hypothetical protein
MSHCEAFLTRVLRCVSLAAVFLAVFGATGITITKSELNSSQLRVEGGGALPNHSISINPGNLTGTTDAYAMRQLADRRVNRDAARLSSTRRQCARATCLFG